MFRILVFMILLSSSLIAFNITEDTIIVKSKSKKIIDEASDVLSSYLEKITENKPQVLGYIPKGKKAIIITKLSQGDVKEDGFIIKSVDKHLVISGSNDRGLLFGIYYFLDHYLGCRFLSADYEYIPKFKSKKIGKINDKQEPRFTYREIFFGESDDPTFAYKNLLNGRLGHRIIEDNEAHVFPNAINTHSYLSSALLDDQFSCSGQYDFASISVQKYALSSLDKLQSKLPFNRKKYVMIEHEDRGSFCTDGLNAGEVPSKTFLSYARYLADNLGKLYPYDQFFYQAYLWSRKAPKNVSRLPTNLGVHFAGIEADFSQPLYAKDNSKIWSDLKQWGRLTDHVVVWHYVTNFSGFLFPHPNLFALDQDIKALSKQRFVKGLFLQGGGIGANLANLRVWVYAKLLWNPDQDIDGLIKEFCHYYYSDAAEYVQKYIKLVDSFFEQSNEKLSLKTPIDAKYLKSENLDILDSLLSQALSKVAPGSIYHEHIQALFLGIDYIRLMRGDGSKNRIKMKNRFQRYLKKHSEITMIAEDVQVDNILKVIDLKRKIVTNPPLAKNIQNANDWLSFQEYQLELCCADIIEDKLASDGVSAVMPGSSEEWGFSLPLINIPKGKWAIYADVRVEKNSHTLVDHAKWALRYGIDPTFIKGVSISAQFDNGYQSIKIGTIDTQTSDAEFVWLSPPGNEVIKRVFVDRIYFIREHQKF